MVTSQKSRGKPDQFNESYLECSTDLSAFPKGGFGLMLNSSLAHVSQSRSGGGSGVRPIPATLRSSAVSVVQTALNGLAGPADESARAAARASATGRASREAAPSVRRWELAAIRGPASTPGQSRVSIQTGR